MSSRNAERVGLGAERDKLRAADPEGLAGAWAMLGDIWAGTVARAGQLPGPVLRDLQCRHVILKEEWQHHRYAVRDLDVLEKRPR